MSFRQTTHNSCFQESQTFGSYSNRDGLSGSPRIGSSKSKIISINNILSFENKLRTKTSPKSLTNRPVLSKESPQKQFKSFCKTRTPLKCYNTALQAFNQDNYLECIKVLSKGLKSDQNCQLGLYLRGKAYSKQGEWAKSISDYLTVININSTFNCEIYIEVAKCFIELKDYQTAIRQLTRGLMHFPQFIDGYLSRGNIYHKLCMWDNAIFDFSQVLNLTNSSGPAYIGLAESLKAAGRLEEAVKVLGSALACPEPLSKALIIRGKIFFELRQYDEALEDLEKIKDEDINCVEAFYYKAFCFMSKLNLIDSAVCFEQVVKYDGNKKYSGAALYNLGAIKIKQKDFFGAYFTFQRAYEMGVEIPEQVIAKKYVEAVLFLIKRNFEEGAKLLSKIINKKEKWLEEHIGDCLEYRAYSYAFLDQHEKVVNDLKEAKKIQEIDKTSEYNLTVSEGILLRESQGSIELFDKAYGMFKNIEPLVYKSAVFFQRCLKAGSKAVESKELLDAAIRMRENESELYFYRGVVLYYNQRTVEAIYDLEKAIDKADDNLPRHFLAKGCCSARIKAYKEAVDDFSITLHLDAKSHLAYLYRARCHYLLEELDSAYEDFQSALGLDKSCGSLFISFLIYSGSYNEALKISEELCSQDSSVQNVYSKIQCLIFLEKIDLVLKDLGKLAKINAEGAKSDIEMFSIFKIGLGSGINELENMAQMLESTSDGKGVCTLTHKKWLKGCFLMYKKKYWSARECFTSIPNISIKKCREIERNTAEIIFNIALCYYLEDDYISAADHLNDICNYLDDLDKGKVLFLISLTKLALNSTSDARVLMKEAYKLDPELVKQYTDKNKQIKVLPLDSDSLFLQKFPFISLKFTENVEVLVRPSLGFPRPDLPNFEFSTEPDVLQFFQVTKVKCKPETPFLNRVGGSIQFTEEVKNLKSEESEDSSIGDDMFSDESLSGSGSFSICDKKIESGASSMSDI